MRYTVKTLRAHCTVTDYTLDGNGEDLRRAVRELEAKGEQIVTTHAARVTMDGKPYAGTSKRR
jgi:hypothetical protein